MERAIQKFDTSQLELLLRALSSLVNEEPPSGDHTLEELEILCRERGTALASAVEALSSLVQAVEAAEGRMVENYPQGDGVDRIGEQADTLKHYADRLEDFDPAEDDRANWFEVWRAYRSVRHNARIAADLSFLQQQEADAAAIHRDGKEGADLREAKKMIRTVAEAARNGTKWDSGADLKRWLSDRFGWSTSTIERRLDDAGAWHRPGKKGKTSVTETVRRCLFYTEV